MQAGGDDAVDLAGLGKQLVDLARLQLQLDFAKGLLSVATGNHARIKCKFDLGIANLDLTDVARNGDFEDRLHIRCGQLTNLFR